MVNIKMKKLFILLFTSFLISCGGGGGGGGSSSSATPINYSYDKTTADYTSKTWQADAVTRRVRSQSWDYFASHGSDPDGPIQINFTENSDYVNINLSHKLANFDIRLSEIDDSPFPLVDSSGNIFAYIANNNYSDTKLSGQSAFFFLPEYLASQNIEHTNVGFVDLYFESAARDTFAINYGSKTFPGDMPTSGTATYEIFAQANHTEYLSPTRATRFILRGEGSLNANFSANKISGSIALNSWYSNGGFLVFGGATSQAEILNVPVLTISFPETSISGNSFEWDIGNFFTLTSSGGRRSGEGLAGGSFFGPDGKEVSGTFLGRENDNDTSGRFRWDIIGVFYGTCKSSGC